MPDPNFISGNDMYVKMDDGAVLPFNDWTLTIDPGNKKFFAAGSAFQRTLPGGIAGTIEASGPYDEGNMPMTAGVVYEFHLGMESGVEFVVNARLGPIKYNVKLDAGGEPAGCAITADSDGEFDINLT